MNSSCIPVNRKWSSVPLTSYKQLVTICKKNQAKETQKNSISTLVSKVDTFTQINIVLTYVIFFFPK